MITLNIHLFNNTKYNPQFKASYPKLVVDDIRDIRRLTCARCGGEMLSQPEFEDFLKKFLVGSVAALKSPVFNCIRDSKAFKIIEQIAKTHPKTPISKLISENMEAVDVKSAELNKVSKFVIEQSDKMCKNSTQTINLLKSIKDELPEEQQAELDYMEVLASKYPTKTFAEIFRIPEVKEFLQKSYECENQILGYRVTDFFDKIVKISKNSKYTEMIKNTTMHASVLAVSESDIPIETRKLLINFKFHNLFKDIDDKILVNKLKKHVLKMPYRENSPQASLSKYCEGYDDLCIITDFVKEVKSTWEHIIPDSKGGSKGMENGLCMHRHCNNKRANIPYSVIYKLDSSFATHIQTQMNRIMGYINHGNLINHDRLPQEVKRTLLLASNGKIKLNIKKFLKRQNAIKENNLQKNKNHLDEQVQMLQTIEQDMNQRSKEIDNWKNIIEKLTNRIADLNKINQERLLLKKMAEESVNNANKEYNAAKAQFLVLQDDICKDNL